MISVVIYKVWLSCGKKAGRMEHSVRSNLLNNLLIQLANHCTTWGALKWYLESMMKLFILSWILNILTHFLESNSRMKPDFLYVIKYKKRNIKLSLGKDWLYLLNMRRKINKRDKYKIILRIWKIENFHNFHNNQLHSLLSL